MWLLINPKVILESWSFTLSKEGTEKMPFDPTLMVIETRKKNSKYVPKRQSSYRKPQV